MEIGTKEWFIERALNTLTFNKEGNFWDFSDSSLVYTPGSEEEYKEVQEEDTEYNKLVTTQEHALLRQIAGDVIQKLPQKFLYIDLGPGTEHKEQYFFDAIKTQGKEVIYVPVDINLKILKEASAHAEQQGLSVLPNQSLFEDLDTTTRTLSGFKFISLGLTFTNYKPDEILSIFKKTINGDGAAFITVQLRDRVDIKKVEKQYGEEGFAYVVTTKMKLLGFEKGDFLISTDDMVQTWAKIKNVPDKLKELGVKEGDTFLLFRSIRYLKEDLETIFKQNGFTVRFFDAGNSFLGILLT